MANSAPAYALEIPKQFPEFEKASRMRYAMRTRFRSGELSFYEDYGFYADSLFLEIMSFELLAGDLYRALDEPNSVVISQELAQKYFGQNRPLGELLEMNGERSLRVTGILKSIPKNSHLNFDFLISFSTYQVPPGYASDLTSWTWAGFLTYAKLKEGVDPARVSEKVNDYINDQINSTSRVIQTHLQPLKDIYMGSGNLTDDLNSNLRSGNRFTTYSLGVVSILILLIACFNFTNLSVAISFNRMREMGLRKVLGAQRKTLWLQLISDSLLISFASLGLSSIWIFLATKFLIKGLGWNFVPSFETMVPHLPIIIGGTLVLAILSGAYPALLLSRVNSVNALKGTTKTRGGLKLKYGLVVTQFFISIGLITSTLVIIKQLNHVRNQNLGLDKENVVQIRLLPEDMTEHFELFKQRLLQNTGILGVSRSERLIGDPWPANSIRLDGQTSAEAIEVTGNLVDYDYFKTLGIPLKSGRAFSKEFKTDTLNSIILNESAVAHLGLEDPIGAKVEFFSINGPRTIIGVMEDFNFSSLHKEIGPAVLVIPFIDLEFAMVRLSPGNIREHLNTIESTWKSIAPEIPLDMKFMDSHLYELYESEEQLSKLISSFSVLGILLACLGLYGLISFSINSRLKEISIRKVLGAGGYSILKLVSSEYLILIIIGFMIALPSAFYILNAWLDQFAYRIDISLMNFIIAVLLLTSVCIVVIGKKVLTTLKTNPATILRNE